jgi:hypothetical protein
VSDALGVARSLDHMDSNTHDDTGRERLWGKAPDVRPRIRTSGLPGACVSARMAPPAGWSLASGPVADEVFDTETLGLPVAAVTLVTTSGRRIADRLSAGILAVSTPTCSAAAPATSPFRPAFTAGTIDVRPTGPLPVDYADLGGPVDHRSRQPHRHR